MDTRCYVVDPSRVVQHASGLQICSLDRFDVDASMLVASCLQNADPPTFAIRCKAGYEIPCKAYVRIPISTPFQDLLAYERSGLRYIVRTYPEERAGGAWASVAEDIADVYLSFFRGPHVEIFVVRPALLMVHLLDMTRREPSASCRLGVSVCIANETGVRARVSTVSPDTAAMDSTGVLGGRCHCTPTYRTEKLVPPNQWLIIWIDKAPADEWPWFEACMLWKGRFVVVRHGTLHHAEMLPPIPCEELDACRTSALL